MTRLVYEISPEILASNRGFLEAIYGFNPQTPNPTHQASTILDKCKKLTSLKLIVRTM